MPEDRRPDYEGEREGAVATTDRQAEHVRARREVREQRDPLPAPPRARIAGWPWIAALIIAVGFLVWLAVAVWT